MEYVEGLELEAHVRNHPSQINALFSQAISGFAYLERSKILHRDIRRGNILVNRLGELKIIDLGFGKQVTGPEAFDKSIDLNWWCAVPKEFSDGRYDFCTEVYFVGKLFEEIVNTVGIGDFRYSGDLERMCTKDPMRRTQSFTEIERSILSEQFLEVEFSEEELQAYRAFSVAMSALILKIERDAKYVDDVNKIRSQLRLLFTTFMLEDVVPDSAIVFRCFITGGYRYFKNRLRVKIVEDFIKLLTVAGEGKSRIILANLHTKLDAIERYDGSPSSEDDVPF